MKPKIMASCGHENYSNGHCKKRGCPNRNELCHAHGIVGPKDSRYVCTREK